MIMRLTFLKLLLQEVSDFLETIFQNCILLDRLSGIDVFFLFDELSDDTEENFVISDSNINGN